MIPQGYRGLPAGPTFPANVADLTELAATPVSILPDGYGVWVEAEKAYAVIDTSAAALVPGQIIASLDVATPRRWFMQPPIAGANPFLAQLVVYFNSATGSNAASGTAAAPLQTLAEWKRRVGLPGQQLNAIYQLVFLAPEPDPSLTVDLGPAGMVFLDFRSAVTLLPAPPLGWPLHVAGYVAPNNVNEYGVITTVEAGALAGYLDPTQLHGARIRITASAVPARVGATCFIATDNPAGVGVNAVRVSRPINCTGNTLADPIGPNVVPAAGDSFVIENLQNSGNLFVHATKTSPNPSNTNSVTVHSIGMATGLAAGTTGRCVFVTPPDCRGGILASDLNTFEINGSGVVSGTRAQGQSSGVITTGTQSDSVVGPTLLFNSCLFHDSTFSSNASYQWCLWQANLLGATWQATLNPEPGFTSILGASAFFDSLAAATPSAISMTESGAFLFLGDIVWSSGITGYGVYISAPGTFLDYANAGVKPVNLVGALANTRITGVNTAWAGIPVIIAATNSGILTHVA